MAAVWDPLLRLLHWSVVIAVAVAWWAGEERLNLHVWAGYFTLAALAVRLAWGRLGGRHARFASFVRPPREVGRYAMAVVRGRASRHLGHNPLGGWMVLALLLSIAVTGASGWLYTTDRFWGMAWVEMLHKVSAWTMVGLVALHVAGVLLTSLQHAENLVGAMLTGRKRPAAQGDVD